MRSRVAVRKYLLLLSAKDPDLAHHTAPDPHHHTGLGLDPDLAHHIAPGPHHTGLGLGLGLGLDLRLAHNRTWLNSWIMTKVLKTSVLLVSWSTPSSC